MKKETRLLLIFFTILTLVIILKFTKEYRDIQQTYMQAAIHEARSLNHMVQSFGHSYSNLINQLKIPLDKESLQLRPVLRLPEISKLFSEIGDTNAHLRTVSMNPMNPENMVTETEKILMDFFVQNPDKKEKVMALENGQFLYANVLRVKSKCLTCHGSKETAPAVIRELYSTGYDYKLNDILGIRLIRYQNSNILNNMMKIYYRNIVAASLVFSSIYFSIFLMMRYLSRRDKKHLQQLEQHNQNLFKEQQRLNTLLNAMDIAIVFENTRGVISYVNKAFNKIWHIPEGTTVTGVPVESFQSKSSAKIVNEIEQVSSKGNQIQTELHLDNQKIVLKNQIEITSHSNETYGNLILFEDVTEKHQANQKLIYLAERDALTGLYNRHKFQTEIALMHSLIKRNDELLVLFFFDLDEFKLINDNYGHEQGDSVLISIVNAVNIIIRPSDLFFRLGGDEFAVLSIMTSVSEIKSLAQRLIREISKISFRFDDNQVRLTASLGCSFCSRESGNCNDLLSQADIAMYDAKSRGKNTLSIYSDITPGSSVSLDRLSWNEKIDSALEQDLFELHFQGVFCVKTGKLVHLEALIRLKDEDDPGQLIYPGIFIPFAEKTGKILDIDRWVIKKACQLLGGNTDMPPLAINISGRSFDQPELPRYIGEQLEINQVNPKRLLVELTETEAVSDLMDAREFIEALHEVGCPVCLDDFGSGFSSFAYLKYLTVEILKIDGIFITDLHQSIDNQLFVESMTHVANGMNKRSIAEFVESREVLQKLRDLGVDMAQGYYLDMPQKDHPALTGNFIVVDL